MGAPPDERLPLHEPNTAPPTRSRYVFRGIMLVLAVIALNLVPYKSSFILSSLTPPPPLPVHCPVQPSPIAPPQPFKEPQRFKHAAAERWSGAVQARTESFDEMDDVGKDPRWDAFFEFAEYLKRTYSTVHEKLDLEKVNTHGLLYTWQGSDESLKPVVLMAHQDTVPVPPETVPRWTHPPFSGHIDADGWVWGRGVSDCKRLLISLFEAITLLIEQDFHPTRTVVLSLGFDEEVSGLRGAQTLAQRLEEIYGRDSVFLLVDEGGSMKDDVLGKAFALPGMSEKGYLDVQISVAVPGGHSSVPPKHTGIGILAHLIGVVEEHQHNPHLSPFNPFTTHLQCVASYAPELPASLRRKLRDVRKWDEAAEEVASWSGAVRYLMQTSQAVDIISGGVKINALPELAYAVINQRITVSSSPAEVEARLERILRPHIEKHLNLTFIGFDDHRDPNEVVRAVKLSVFGGVTPPAPRTPAEGAAWDVLAGTIRHLFPAPDGSERIVSPYISTGNTDTRWYWNLTRNIYRFQAVEAQQAANIHTVDERAHIDGLLSSIKFIHALIQNADRARE